MHMIIEVLSKEKVRINVITDAGIQVTEIFGAESRTHLYEHKDFDIDRWANILCGQEHSIEKIVDIGGTIVYSQI